MKNDAVGVGNVADVAEAIVSLCDLMQAFNDDLVLLQQEIKTG